MHVFGRRSGKKPEYQERLHERTGIACKLHTGRSQLTRRFNPFSCEATLLLYKTLTLKLIKSSFEVVNGAWFQFGHK